MTRDPRLTTALLLALASTSTAQTPAAQTVRPSDRLTVSVTFPAARSATSLDGRLLLLVSTDSTSEPRFQIADGPGTQVVFGTDADGWAPGQEVTVGAAAFGYPLRSLADLPPGRYWGQALLNRYETFRRSDGHVVKLPPDRGEGQQWNRKPGNLYSTPRWMQLDARLRIRNVIELDREIAPIPDPQDSRYIRHVTIVSERLSKFWGRPFGDPGPAPWGAASSIGAMLRGRT